MNVYRILVQWYRQGKLKYREKKFVLVSPCPLQILRGLLWYRTPPRALKRPATNRPNCDTAWKVQEVAWLQCWLCACVSVCVRVCTCTFACLSACVRVCTCTFACTERDRRYTFELQVPVSVYTERWRWMITFPTFICERIRTCAKSRLTLFANSNQILMSHKITRKAKTCLFSSSTVIPYKCLGPVTYCEPV